MGTDGPISVQQHRLCLWISVSIHRGVCFDHLPNLADGGQLRWHSWAVELLAGVDSSERTLVALVLTPGALAALRPSTGSADYHQGVALERAVHAMAASQVQVLDSVHFEPVACVLSLLLPTPGAAPFFALPPGTSAFDIVMLDVQKWQVVCRPVSLPYQAAPSEEATAAKAPLPASPAASPAAAMSLAAAMAPAAESRATGTADGEAERALGALRDAHDQASLREALLGATAFADSCAAIAEELPLARERMRNMKRAQHDRDAVISPASSAASSSSKLQCSIHDQD
eukprot:1301015-Prymnesium_polylepis.2